MKLFCLSMSCFILPLFCFVLLCFGKRGWSIDKSVLPWRQGSHTMKRQWCWCPKPILFYVDTFFSSNTFAWLPDRWTWSVDRSRTQNFLFRLRSFVKAEIHMKAVFWLGIMVLTQISRLRFKQSRISMLIPLIYVLGRFVNFWWFCGYIWR